MKHIIGFLLKFVICVFVIYGGFCGTAFACESNQIDVLGDGTQCELAKFSLTTTNMNADTEFRFYMSASGTFYVDWGDGTVDTITRTNTTETLYSHTFTTSGTKTIRMAGLATGYSTDLSIATIRFGAANTDSTTPKLIASISGNLSEIFPYMSQNTTTNEQPRFLHMFRNAVNLQTIPDTLFANYTIGSRRMFFYAFASCSGLKTIPGNLFSRITTGVPDLFAGVFDSCSGLTSIPADLFAGITVGKTSMFSYAFAYCTNLTTIPAGLFDHITADGHMFVATFVGCSKLNSIPSGLFRNMTKAYAYTFYYMFANCRALTSIPPDLFANITSAEENAFWQTFYGCTGLTSIPADLFSGITKGAINMFQDTFSYCTNLSGYIPPSTFSGLIANGATNTNSMWNNTFGNTKLATTCPSGTVQFVTGYEQYWDGRVSCIDENLVCGPGEYFHAHDYKCSTCPENNYCVGGTYPYSETVSAGATQCPNSWYSPAGSSSIAQCGRILHVGDNVVYLRSGKKTTPSLNFDLDNDGTPDFFGNMTTADVPMNINTEQKLKINYNGQTYSAYDDTVTVPE